MYSVIIQNQKTMDSFLDYQALFDEGTNNDRIGICKWNESGDTIDTAVPDLKNLTDDKTEWRAIIVRYIDDIEMSEYTSDIYNPYDFDICKEINDSSEEIPVPIIRLTQMLGGIPPLEVNFSPTVIKEEHKAPRIIYEQVFDEEKEKRHALLSQKLNYCGKKPSSIIIISVRKNQKEKNLVNNAWQTHKESKSSEFWKKNYYPSICRFLVFDFLDEGETQKIKDEFYFWLSVMLICNNDIEPSVLQAYRLYRLSLDIDKKNMEESFQTIVNRLRHIKTRLETEAKTNLINAICEEKKLPDYQVDIPLKLKIPQSKKNGFNAKAFGIFSKGAESEISKWNFTCAKIENSIKQSITTAERNLDQASEKVKIHCNYNDDEVYSLNRYQEEDLRNETEELFLNIINMQGELPSTDFLQKEEMKKSSKAVRKYLTKRVKRKPFFIALIVAFIMLLLAMFPTIINVFSGDNNLSISLIFLLGSALLMAISGVLILLFQKSKLNALIDKYNSFIKNEYFKLTSNASNYKKYLSAIASHVRGTSYLNIHSNKKYLFESEYDRKSQRILSINTFLIKIRSWCKSINLNVDFESGVLTSFSGEVMFDGVSKAKILKPELYENYQAEINHSGVKIDTPFSYVKKINIIREELYDE